MKYGAITIIYNPKSTGSSQAMARAFERNLLAKLPKQKVTLRPTEYAGHAEELAYALAKESKNPLIISSSGDGGYHEVVNGVMRAQKEGHRATAGLLPAGNANDHHRNLHTEDLIESIVAGKERSIDVLTLEGVSKGKSVQRYGHSYIGFGLSPFVASQLNKNKLNVFNQVWFFVQALVSQKSVKLNLDGKNHHYDSVIFSNVPSMSKYLKISKPSRVDDGMFEVTIFRRRNKMQLTTLLLKAIVTGVEEDVRVKSFKLRTVKETLVQIDGEIATLDPRSEVRIGIEKQSLNCIV
jgi:diacylglycerol kinase family enzyme